MDRDRREPEAGRPDPGVPAEPAVDPEPRWRPLPRNDPRASSWARTVLTPGAGPCRRREERIAARLPVSTTFIDAVRDPVTGEVCYHTNDADQTLTLSRRGAGLRCESPPDVGTRLLLQMDVPGERPVELVGRTRWTRVEYIPGEHGGRAVAVVGVEVLGGSPSALDRYEAYLARLAAADSVAGAPATG